MSGLNLENIAIALGLKKPKKFAFLRNGVQPVANVVGKCKVDNLGTIAGNVLYEFSPPKGKRYLVHGARFTCATDATVANRYIRISRRTNDDTSLGYYGSTGAVAASSVGALTMKKGDTATGHYDSYVSLTAPIIITSDIHLLVQLANGVAGDTFTGAIFYEEVFDS